MVGTSTVIPPADGNRQIEDDVEFRFPVPVDFLSPPASLAGNNQRRGLSSATAEVCVRVVERAQETYRSRRTRRTRRRSRVKHAR